MSDDDDDNALVLYQMIEGMEQLNLESAEDDADVFRKILESIEELDVARLKSLLQANPDLDLCQRFETTKPCGIYRDFNFAPGTKLKQNLYLCCFDEVSDPARCGAISEMIGIFHESGFICTEGLWGPSSPQSAVKNVAYVILRKIALCEKNCQAEFREGYLNLSALVRDHAVSWLQDIPIGFSWPAPRSPHATLEKLWEIDVFIAVELQDHEKVEIILQGKESSRMGNFIGPILDENELAGPEADFIGYPAVWLSMMKGDTRMIKLLSPCGSDIAFVVKVEPLLLLKFFRKVVSEECWKQVWSMLPKKVYPLSCDNASAEHVLIAGLISVAENKDCAEFKKGWSSFSRNRQPHAVYRNRRAKRLIGLTFFPGSCQKTFRVLENDAVGPACVKAMSNPQLQNRKSLGIVALENGDVELLKYMHAEGIPIYDNDLKAGDWKDVVIYSSVMYNSVKDALEREDKDFLTLLFTKGVGDSVAPMVMYHAAHQNDLDLITTLIKRFGDIVMHLRPEDGKTCHQISLLEFEECSEVHQGEVQKRLMDRLNETSKYKSDIQWCGGKDTLYLSQLTELSKEGLLTLLDIGDYTKVLTDKGSQPLLLTYLKYSSVPYDFETFCSIKEKLKAKDSSAIGKISDSLLAYVTKNTDVEFLVKFLRDDDIQMDIRVSEDEDLEPHKSPLCIFKNRLESDETLEQCVDSFLSLFEDNLAFFYISYDGCRALAIFHGKKGNCLTSFEMKLLDRTIEWLCDRHDCLPILARVLTYWPDPANDGADVPKQLETIFDYIMLKSPKLLTTPNKLGMNFPMYCAALNGSDHSHMILHSIENGPFDINAKAEVSNAVQFDLQHIHGKVRSGKDRNTTLERGVTWLKEAKVLNEDTGEYESAVKPKFRDHFASFISTQPMPVSDGAGTKNAHVVVMARTERKENAGHTERKDDKDETETKKEPFELVLEHLETCSLVSDGSGLRSRRGRKFKGRSDVETLAADLGSSDLEELLTRHYAVGTNVLLLAIKSGAEIMTYHLLSLCTFDVMHRDDDKVSPLILAVKSFQDCGFERSFGLSIVELILLQLDHQISKLSKYDSWVTCKGVRSTRDYLLQDFDESGGRWSGKTARQIAEGYKWPKVVELIDSRLNVLQCDEEIVRNGEMINA